MTASNIRAGGAYVEINAKLDSLKSGLGKAQTMLRTWGSGLTRIGTSVFAPFAAAGVAGVGSMLALGSTIGDIGGTIDDTAQRTGITTEAISELGYAAELAGADLPTLESGLVKMQRTLAAASEGSKTAQAALADLGLSLGDLSSLSQDDQFAAIAERIAGIDDPAKKTAASMAIFGKAGQKLLPVLNAGSDGIAAMRKEARDLGVSMSQRDATAAADFGDAVENLQRSVKSVGFTLASTLAPILIGTVKHISAVIGGVTNWVKANRGIIIGIAVGVAAFAALGAAIAATGIAITGLSFVFGALISAVNALSSLAAFAFTPLGIGIAVVAAAVAGLGYLFFTATDMGREALGYLVDTVKQLVGEIVDSFGAISTALGAGDITAAWDVVTSYLSLQWTRVIGVMMSAWETLSGFIVEVFDEASTNLAVGFTNAIAGLESAWVSTVGFLGDAWDAVITRITQAWSTAQKYIATGIGYIVAALQGLDPTEVVADIQATYDAQINKAGDGLNQRLGDREKARADRLAGIEANRTDSAGGLRDDRNRRSSARSDATAKAEAQRQAELAAAQKKLADSIARANSLGNGEVAKATEPTTTAIKQQAAQVAANTGRASAADITTTEGLKAVLDLIGGTRRDPVQEEIATNTSDLADTADDQLTVMRAINTKLTVGLPA